MAIPGACEKNEPGQISLGVENLGVGNRKGMRLSVLGTIKIWPLLKRTFFSPGGGESGVINAGVLGFGRCHYGAGNRKNVFTGLGNPGMTNLGVPHPGVGAPGDGIPGVKFNSGVGVDHPGIGGGDSFDLLGVATREMFQVFGICDGNPRAAAASVMAAPAPERHL